MISDTASYCNDIFALHFVIVSCIAICAFFIQIYYLLNYSIYLIIRFRFLLFSRATVGSDRAVSMYPQPGVACRGRLGL